MLYGIILSNILYGEEPKIDSNDSIQHSKL